VKQHAPLGMLSNIQDNAGGSFWRGKVTSAVTAAAVLPAAGRHWR
jgi:hypothetical protein